MALEANYNSWELVGEREGDPEIPSTYNSEVEAVKAVTSLGFGATGTHLNYVRKQQA